MTNTKNIKKIRRILLIEPPKTTPKKLMERTRPSVQPPIGLAYLAGILEKNKYEVKILDANIEGNPNGRGVEIDNETIRYGLSDKEIESFIEQYRPDVVGVSCVVSAKYKDAKNICKIVKKVHSNCITIMGGAHPTLTVEKTLKDKNLDYIVLGEAEQSLIDLLDYIQRRKTKEELDGIAMKQQGKIIVIPKTKYIEDLDQLPFPARHLLDLKKYWEINLPHGEATRTPWTTMITSRGCPAQCIYCSAGLLWGRKYRMRSAENVLEEIKQLIDKYGIKELLIEDDNFSFNKKRTKKILDGIIDNKWDITWTTPNGIAIFTLDEEILQKMKQSGCNSLTLAVESGSQRVLNKVMKKPLSLKKVREIMPAAKKLGIKTKAFYMLGIPGETKEEMEQTLEIAKELRADWSCFSITTPLPGTELYDICKQEKYIDGDIDPTKIEYTTCRIKTKEFDKEFVDNLWEEANNINFLENPNLQKGGNVRQAIKDLKRVIRLVPGHKLAEKALKEAYSRK